MARPAALVLALLLLPVALAGCSGGGGGTATTTTGANSAPDPCPGATASSAVTGWTRHGGMWGRVHADGAEAVCGKADRALSTLVRDEGSYTDLEANVSFEMLAGDSGAGLVIHFQGEQDYNIVRYSPREQGWHIFTVVAGNRQKHNEGSVTPPTTNPELGEWVALRVRSEGGRVMAWHGDVQVIDYTLRPEASHAGRAGLFLRDEGMAAHFRDYAARAL